MEAWMPWSGLSKILAPTPDKIAMEYAGTFRLERLHRDQIASVGSSRGLLGTSLPARMVCKAVNQ